MLRTSLSSLLEEYSNAAPRTRLTQPPRWRRLRGVSLLHWTLTLINSIELLGAGTDAGAISAETPWTLIASSGPLPLGG